MRRELAFHERRTRLVERETFVAVRLSRHVDGRALIRHLAPVGQSDHGGRLPRDQPLVELDQLREA